MNFAQFSLKRTNYEINLILQVRTAELAFKPVSLRTVKQTWSGMYLARSLSNKAVGLAATISLNIINSLFSTPTFGFSRIVEFNALN